MYSKIGNAWLDTLHSASNYFYQLFFGGAEESSFLLYAQVHTL